MDSSRIIIGSKKGKRIMVFQDSTYHNAFALFGPRFKKFQVQFQDSTLDLKLLETWINRCVIKAERKHDKAEKCFVSSCRGKGHLP